MIDCTERHNDLRYGGVGINGITVTEEREMSMSIVPLLLFAISLVPSRLHTVVARFNEIVTKPLLEVALATFKAYSVAEEDVDIREDTTHYDAVANSAACGVLSASLNSGVPCMFGVLTCKDMEQALNRAGGRSRNKGAEAALTAIEMASLFEHHLK